MSDFDVKEKRFEEDIEDYLTHHGGYTKGDPKKFNRESGLEEDTFVEFIKTSQPKKWERYVKIYAENSEKQIIERFKREVKTTNLLNVMRHGFMDRGIKFYPIFWKPETSLNETTQMQYDANILHCTRQLHYSVHNENSIDIVLFANGIPVVSMKCLRLKNRIYLSLPWQVLTVCMPILHRYADYLTRIFIDSVFIQNSYTQCFLRDMVERR